MCVETFGVILLTCCLLILFHKNTVEERARRWARRGDASDISRVNDCIPLESPRTSKVDEPQSLSKAS